MSFSRRRENDITKEVLWEQNLVEAMRKANVELEQNRNKAIHNFVCTVDGVEDHQVYDNAEFLNLVSTMLSCLRDSK